MNVVPLLSHAAEMGELIKTGKSEEIVSKLITMIGTLNSQHPDTPIKAVMQDRHLIFFRATVEETHYDNEYAHMSSVVFATLQTLAEDNLGLREAFSPPSES